VPRLSPAHDRPRDGHRDQPGIGQRQAAAGPPNPVLRVENGGDPA